MKLVFSPSSLLSAEDKGLLPRFMKCRDMARSSSWASTAEPAGTGTRPLGGPRPPPASAACARLCRASPHPSRPPGARQPDQTHLEAESIPGVN